MENKLIITPSTVISVELLKSLCEDPARGAAAARTRCACPRSFPRRFGGGAGLHAFFPPCPADLPAVSAGGSGGRRGRGRAGHAGGSAAPRPARRGQNGLQDKRTHADRTTVKSPILSKKRTTTWTTFVNF